MANSSGKTVLAVALALFIPIGCPSAPCAAADQKPLVDKDFEYCLNKQITRRFCNRLDATDEQREKITGLFTRTMDETRPLRQEVRSRLLGLSALAANDAATDADITAKVVELRALRTKIADQRLAALLALRKMLTPAQRKQIHEHITELLTGGISPRHLSMLINP